MFYPKILAVDDDHFILNLLGASFEQDGWDMVTADDGEKALGFAHDKTINVVILDLIMPKVDGMKVCRQLREDGCSVPILILSAVDDPLQKAKCLEMGADDYLTKPFSIEELKARVRALLRRTSNELQKVFKHQDITIDFEAHKVLAKGEEVVLTPIEFKLLEHLTFHAGHVIGYSTLLKKVWGSEYAEEREYLHVHIGHLLAKLERGNQKFIENIHGIGYRINLG